MSAPSFAIEDGVPVLRFPDDRRLRLDFADSRYHRKLRGKNELLAKAVGIKTLPTAPRVWDLSLGLAEDAWTLARLGCDLWGFERQPLLAQLVEASLQEYRMRVEPGSHWDESAARLHVNAASARDVLLALRDGTSAFPRPGALYFDPMYEGTGKSSALPRLEMQLLRGWVGTDDDQAEVLALARSIPGMRVVVKRAVKAPALGGAPTHAFVGEKVRYDMYQNTVTASGATDTEAP